MIFYFSGTGNSLQAAKSIADAAGEALISISREMKEDKGVLEYNLKDNETIGFVYPVYAWSPPEMVLKFIGKLRFTNYRENYTFSIATCGDNIGNTMKVIEKSLKKRDMKLDSGFSLIMPNNYIFLYDVDPKEIEKRKLEDAKKRLEEIGNVIRERKSKVFELVKGPFPGILTGVINPLFGRFSLNPQKFHADDSCTGCGLCEKICNTGTIKVNGKPTWGTECTQCLACIHRCPVHAIQYGKSTAKKARYKNPVLK